MLVDALKQFAKENGFALSGVVDIAQAQNHYQKHLEHYRAWLKQGYAGSMSYLERGVLRREQVDLVFPEAKSVFCVALSYSTLPLGEGVFKPKLARYLRGRDYHQEIPERLEKTLLSVKEKIEPQLKWKICTDTSAVLERTWAWLAGLGWIGKNTMLIHPQLGSYFLLGEAFLNIETGVSPNPHPDYCGRCTACLQGCPTQALLENKNLNANQCISYQSLEHRGERPQQMQESLKYRGAWIAGCDVCQEVCPYNKKRTEAERLKQEDVKTELLSKTWSEWQGLSQNEYDLLVRDLALNRIRYSEFKRNLGEAKNNKALTVQRDAVLLGEK